MLSQNTINRRDEYKAFYQKHGWISIAEVLEPDFAESELIKYLSYPNWEIVTMRNGQPFAVSLSEFNQLNPQQKNTFINEALMYASKDNFQCYYENVRMQGDAALSNNDFEDILKLYASSDYLDFLRFIVGRDDIDEVVESQLTRYRAGYFLKQHNDEADSAGKKRKAAYVMGFSKNWHADWGGILHLLGENKKIEQSLIPEFNCLNIFNVPRDHLVSQVSNFCPSERIAISGWLAG